MNVQAIVIGLAMVMPVPPSQSPQHTQITCGETERRIRYSGDTVLEHFDFSATAGEVYSFQSTINGAVRCDYWGVCPYVETAVEGSSSVKPDSNGVAWICNWRAPETRTYYVLLWGYTSWGWDVSLTMYCGSPPSTCMVPVTPNTWSNVKQLFR